MEKVKSNPKSLFSRENLFKFSKQVGIVSYYGLGIAVSQPGVLRSKQYDLTNTLLVGSFVGVSSFLYQRKHLEELKPKTKILLSAYGSGLFNLGSLLIWAIVRSATQDYNLHPIFRGFLSIAASYYMVQTGLQWVGVVDKV